jgi:hypothetical protein
MIRGADLSHADICEISTELEGKPRPATPRPRSSPPARPIAAAVVRGPSTPVADCPVTSAGLAWPGRGCRTVPWHGTARLRDLRCVAAVARQARMLRSPKLQCESGRTARGSSRPRLRAPASGGHPSQSSTGRDNQPRSPGDRPGASASGSFSGRANGNRVCGGKAVHRTHSWYCVGLLDGRWRTSRRCQRNLSASGWDSTGYRTGRVADGIDDRQ